MALMRHEPRPTRYTEYKMTQRMNLNLHALWRGGESQADSITTDFGAVSEALDGQESTFALVAENNDNKRKENGDRG